MLDSSSACPFCRYRAAAKPPRYDRTLAELATTALPYAALLHCAVGAWMFTEPNVMLTEKVPDEPAIIRLRTCSLLG